MKRLFLAVACCMMGFIMSCKDDGNKNIKKMDIDVFFSQYLTVLCNAAATHNGIITDYNKAKCPDAILQSTFEMEYFHVGEAVLFKQVKNVLADAAARGDLYVLEDQALTCFSVIEKIRPYNPFDIHLFDLVDCKTAFVGSRPSFDKCSIDEECQDGWCDRGTDFSQCPGTCKLYKKQGDICGQGIDRCEPGYQCMNYGCAKLSVSQQGDPCASDAHCASYLYCDKKIGDTTGICRVRLEQGSECFETRECIIGLECKKADEAEEKLCTALAVPSTAGDSCAQTKECNYFSNLECVQDTCKVFQREEGALCQIQCDAPFYCNPKSKVCAQMVPLDDPCRDNYECSSYYCEKGFCSRAVCPIVSVVE